MQPVVASREAYAGSPLAQILEHRGKEDTGRVVAPAENDEKRDKEAGYDYPALVLISFHNARTTASTS